MKCNQRQFLKTFGNALSSSRGPSASTRKISSKPSEPWITRHFSRISCGTSAYSPPVHCRPWRIPRFTCTRQATSAHGLSTHACPCSVLQHQSDISIYVQRRLPVIRKSASLSEEEEGGRHHCNRGDPRLSRYWRKSSTKARTDHVHDVGHVVDHI